MMRISHIACTLMLIGSALNSASASPQNGFRIDLDYGEIEKVLIGGTFNLGGLPVTG